MKKQLHLSHEDWDKLKDLNTIATNAIRRKLPPDWPLTSEDINGAVYDTIIHLLGIYRTGTMSPVSFCWAYAEQYTYRDLMREYSRLKRQVSLDDVTDDEDEVRHEIGRGDVPELTVDGKKLNDTQIDVAELLDRATPDDKAIMLDIMAGKSYDEIAAQRGLNKMDVTRRMRKYAEVAI